MTAETRRELGCAARRRLQMDVTRLMEFVGLTRMDEPHRRRWVTVLLTEFLVYRVPQPIPKHFGHGIPVPSNIMPAIGDAP